jgi:ankyrin repeat protein
MLQPHELTLTLPMHVANGVVSTTTKVWQILLASYKGDMSTVQLLVAECPELAYAQYNYAPPVHFAVREGHTRLVKYFLSLHAYDPAYRFYPFQESLETVAADRGFTEIVNLLQYYRNNLPATYYNGDNGEIQYNRTALQKEFEKAVDKNNIKHIKELLTTNPEFALDKTFFWSEGILLFAAKENNRPLVDLLMQYGAKVPPVLKWAQFYYFERYDGASYMMEKGMSPNTMSWQHVSLLHDMAQKGFIDKAELLINYGVDFNIIDEAYKSTPLGLAARWGHVEMIKCLIKHGADVNLAGAAWSTPLAWAQKKGHKEIEKILQKAGAK